MTSTDYFTSLTCKLKLALAKVLQFKVSWHRQENTFEEVFVTAQMNLRMHMTPPTCLVRLERIQVDNIRQGQFAGVMCIGRQMNLKTIQFFSNFSSLISLAICSRFSMIFSVLVASTFVSFWSPQTWAWPFSPSSSLTYNLDFIRLPQTQVFDPAQIPLILKTEDRRSVVGRNLTAVQYEMIHQGYGEPFKAALAATLGPQEKCFNAAVFLMKEKDSVDPRLLYQLHQMKNQQITVTLNLIVSPTVSKVDCFVTVSSLRQWRVLALGTFFKENPYYYPEMRKYDPQPLQKSNFFQSPFGSPWRLYLTPLNGLVSRNYSISADSKRFPSFNDFLLDYLTQEKKAFLSHQLQVMNYDLHQKNQIAENSSEKADRRIVEEYLKKKPIFVDPTLVE